MWNFRKWTNGKCTYTSPALSRGDRVEPVVSHINKCNLLRTTLFLPQLQLTNELPIDLEPRDNDNDLAYHKATKWEVHSMLFTDAPMNAPGITRMTCKAYHWMWSILEEEMCHLI